MISMIKEFELDTYGRESLTDITSSVGLLVADSGIKDGLVIVYSPHTTAGITINENSDPDVKADILSFVSRLIPEDWGFAHFEGNSDAHIKASLFGQSVIVPLASGRLVLGTWQGIYFCEFDGPRKRKYLVKILRG